MTKALDTILTAKQRYRNRAKSVTKNFASRLGVLEGYMPILCKRAGIVPETIKKTHFKTLKALHAKVMREFAIDEATIGFGLGRDAAAMQKLRKAGISIDEFRRERVEFAHQTTLSSEIPPRTRRGKFIKMPISNELRWEIWERDNFTCHYCGARRYLAVDHKHPEHLDGKTISENLITACKSCNSKKGKRTYETYMAIIKTEAR